MNDTTKTMGLKGRVIFQFEIKAVTGLHIGGSDAGIEIGGVNKIVIRNPWNNQPYVPGSSLKGKLRSLLEKYYEKELNQDIGGAWIHSCGADYKEEDDKDGKKLQKVKEEYAACEVCLAFGLPGERTFATPTRLVVRDTHLNRVDMGKLNEKNTDLPYTEVKTEVAIDRVTSEANPRTIERVPGGTRFGGFATRVEGKEEIPDHPAEIVYSIYDGGDCDYKNDIDHLQYLLNSFALLEDDYLGGAGSRGSGKVKIQNIKVQVRRDYSTVPEELGVYDNVVGLIEAFQKDVKPKITAAIEKERR